ncbi:hypothetical protein EL22_29030 [Halostagnicola sp. A56]|nr:hypothetical protein [Halostagnicola sp. A56]KMT45640.1 hypothetical protein EL22_29030 [Halostagnicola sp. A56]
MEHVDLAVFVPLLIVLEGHDGVVGELLEVDFRIDLGAATFEYVGGNTIRGDEDGFNGLTIEDLDGNAAGDTIIEAGESLQIGLDLDDSDTTKANTISRGDDATFTINTADNSQTTKVLMAPSTLSTSSDVRL